MIISTPKRPVTEADIDTYAPRSAGVYGLYDRNETIYFGRGESIRDRLKSHKNGNEGPCTQTAEYFNCEPTYNTAGGVQTDSGAEREKQLLQEYEQARGQLPRCNERVG